MRLETLLSVMEGLRRALMRSIESVEPAESVMEHSVETEAAISSTNTTPSKTLGIRTSLSIVGTM